MATRKAYRYKDLDMDMSRHPVTSDFVRVYDTKAIRQSVKNLIMMGFYDKPFHPEVGSPLMGLLFEPMSPATASAIREGISTTLINHEPRISVNSIVVEENDPENAYEVYISFTINNTLEPIQVGFMVQRTR